MIVNLSRAKWLKEEESIKHTEINSNTLERVTVEYVLAQN